MATLSEQQKLFIVQSLACFYSLSEVRDLVRESYAIEIDTAQIARYNPLSAAGVALSKSLKEEFDRTRQAFREDTESIAIAQKNFRLRELDGLYRKAKAKNNTPLAVKILEQAAQDEGGKYTNRREISGPEGVPLKVYGVLSPDDL